MGGSTIIQCAMNVIWIAPGVISSAGMKNPSVSFQKVALVITCNAEFAACLVTHEISLFE